VLSWRAAAAAAAAYDLYDWMKMMKSWPLPDQLAKHATDLHWIHSTSSGACTVYGNGKFLDARNTSCNSPLQLAENTTTAEVRLFKTINVSVQTAKYTLCLDKKWTRYLR